MSIYEYPFISVVVVTKNEEDFIEECIDSIFKLDYPRERYEVIVIDGGSIDNTCQIVQKYPARLIIDQNGNLSTSRNIGIDASKGAYIASTDADCIVKNDWLKILVSNILTAPLEVVAVGGPNLVPECDPLFAKVIGYMQETFFASGGMPQSFKICEDKYVLGLPNCNVLYRKEALVKIGGFDEKLTVGEDAEINSRFTDIGDKYLYVPNAIVWHHREQSLRAFSKKMFSYGKGMGELITNRKVIRWYPFLPSTSLILLFISYPLIKFSYGILYIYILLFIIYLLNIVYTTIYVFKKLYSLHSLYVFFLLPCQHICYGIGFLSGLFRISR